MCHNHWTINSVDISITHLQVSSLDTHLSVTVFTHPIETAMDDVHILFPVFHLPCIRRMRASPLRVMWMFPISHTSQCGWFMHSPGTLQGSMKREQMNQPYFFYCCSLAIVKANFYILQNQARKLSGIVPGQTASERLHIFIIFSILNKCYKYMSSMPGKLMQPSFLHN